MDDQTRLKYLKEKYIPPTHAIVTIWFLGIIVYLAAIAGLYYEPLEFNRQGFIMGFMLMVAIVMISLAMWAFATERIEMFLLSRKLSNKK